MAGVQLEHVVREYVMGKTAIRAVDDISFTIPEGKYTIILGASGAGKSTVLNILGGMDSPTSGLVSVNGKEISSFNKRQLTGYRRESIGFVFQFYNLMANLTVLENVELASQICKNPLNAKEVLQMVGLGALPEPWRKTPTCSYATSPPARWTTRPVRPFWPCCTTCAKRAKRRWWWSPTTEPWPPPPMCLSA